MDNKLKKRIVLISTIIASIIIIAVLILFYQKLMKSYNQINREDPHALQSDEYISSLQNEIVKGTEILNILIKYKDQKDKLNVTYNFYIGGPYDTIYTNSNWDIAINNFMYNNTRYFECLEKDYLVTSSLGSTTGIWLMQFSCQD